MTSRSPNLPSTAPGPTECRLRRSSPWRRRQQRTPKAARPRDIRISDRLRLPAGPVDLSAIDTGATPGFNGSKSDGKAALDLLGPRLADLQERLFAEGRTGGKRSLLLVLQGMDTSGKGGTVRHVVGEVDPQGVSITSFKAPTKEELAHDFLWRIKQRVPAPGMIGVFDRSHYEDVSWSGCATWSSRGPGSAATPRSTGSRRGSSRAARPS